MKNSVSIFASVSTGVFSDHVVNPTRSANRMVTTFVRAGLMSPVALTSAMISSMTGRRVIALEAAADALLLEHVLVEPGPLDRDRGEVGQRRQQVEVLARERPGVQRRIDVDHADDRVAAPEGRAHRGADLLHADGLAGLEALVGLRVRGEHRHLLLHDHVHDRPRVRSAAVAGRTLARREPRDRELQRSPFLEEQEAAVGRQELEDQVHDLVEHGGEVVGGDERLGHLDQDLEDLVLVREVEDDAFSLGGRFRDRAAAASRGRSPR